MQQSMGCSTRCVCVAGEGGVGAVCLCMWSSQDVLGSEGRGIRSVVGGSFLLAGTGGRVRGCNEDRRLCII